MYGDSHPAVLWELSYAFFPSEPEFLDMSNPMARRAEDDVVPKSIYRDLPGPDLNNTVLAIVTTFWACSWVMTCIRVYSRTILTRTFGLDDTMIVSASILATADWVMKLIWTRNGLGHHITHVSNGQLRIFSIVTYARTINYPLVLGLIKISILIFYLRIFPSDRFRLACHIMISLIASMALILSLTNAFECSPLSRAPQWIFNTPSGHCLDRASLGIAGNSLNLASDVIVLFMPIKYLWQLSKVTTRKRLGLVLLFSFGILSCIASAIRLHSVVTFYKSMQDPTYHIAKTAIWSAIEVNIGIIAASVPVCRPFFEKYFFKPVATTVIRPLTQEATTFKTTHTNAVAIHDLPSFVRTPSSERVTRSVNLENSSSTEWDLLAEQRSYSVCYPTASPLGEYQAITSAISKQNGLSSSSEGKVATQPRDEYHTILRDLAYKMVDVEKGSGGDESNPDD